MARASEASIERCTERELDQWVALRQALWPEEAQQDLRRNAEAVIRRAGQAAVFLARVPRHADAHDASCSGLSKTHRLREKAGPAFSHDAFVGFAEATLRNDYVNGCATSPVAFLEGIYVDPDWRKRGIARRLCAAVETWARDCQCRELASDALLDNEASHRMHLALQFEETERVVYFRKELLPPRD
jgi:aminoglycoside 6'-N-acetyltransferase I